MRWSFRVGSIFGIRVEVHVTFLIYVLWIAAMQGLFTGNVPLALRTVALLLMVFVCVLLHELGHALMARRFGVRTRDIILLPFGGVARLQRMPEKPSQEMLVAIAGPLVNVAIAALLAAVLIGTGHPPSIANFSGGLIESLLAVNLLMIAFNLIPAFPMDGGRVLRALLAIRLPYVRATRIASIVGQAFAIVFAIVGLRFNLMGLVLIALFVFLAASEERAMVQSRSTLSGIPVQAAMLTEFHRLDVRDPLRRAVDLLISGSQQDFPVVDGEVPVGLLTRGDLIRGIQQDGGERLVGEVIERDGAFAEAGEPLDDVLARMRGRRRSAMPVLRAGQLVGLITLENVGDLLMVRDALRQSRQAG